MENNSSTKVCHACGIERPITKFAFRSDTQKRRNVCNGCKYEADKPRLQSTDGLAKKRANSRRHYEKNRYKEIERVQAFKRSNPQYQLDWHLRDKFGISLEQFNEMLEDQNGVCAICKKAETAKDSRTGKTRRLHVDHDHVSGKVRGLLCTRCNFALGYALDDGETLANMIAYLAEAMGRPK